MPHILQRGLRARQQIGTDQQEDDQGRYDEQPVGAAHKQRPMARPPSSAIQNLCSAASHASQQPPMKKGRNRV